MSVPGQIGAVSAVFWRFLALHQLCGAGKYCATILAWHDNQRIIRKLARSLGVPWQVFVDQLAPGVSREMLTGNLSEDEK